MKHVLYGLIRPFSVNAQVVDKDIFYADVDVGICFLYNYINVDS
jgi:hypothetical protein